MTTNFLWFALTFWAYLETRSVLVTAIIGGSFMLISALLGMYFGTYVDHHKKKQAMLLASIVSLIAFSIATLIYFIVPQNELLQFDSVYFWLFVLLILGGAVVGNMRAIALSTTVTLLVDKEKRDKANGLVGAVNGLSFTVTSVFSGLAIGQLGMGWALVLSVVFIAGAVIHLLFITLEESLPKDVPAEHKKVDIRGTIAAIHKVPGLMALLFFATFNNLLGGVFMALMDPYGLSLMSVEAWGFLWGVVSLSFILGGLIVAKYGLTSTPLKILFLSNIAMWIICIVFPLRSSILMLGIGMFVYMALIPIVEAAEQTIIQKVVPYKTQGRVFGFGQALESAAAPVSAFIIGPIAQFVIIPNVTSGTSLTWLGTSTDRAIAIVFIIAGVIGLVVTVLAMFSKSYRVLTVHYAE
jgi:DHA3 family multidrug efflux protein-like MFS transporter